MLEPTIKKKHFLFMNLREAGTTRLLVNRIGGRLAKEDLNHLITAGKLEGMSGRGKQKILDKF